GTSSSRSPSSGSTPGSAPPSHTARAPGSRRATSSWSDSSSGSKHWGSWGQIRARLLTASSEGVRLGGDAPCRTGAGPMDFPLKDYLDEGACSRRLVALLHPNGLACPRCGRGQHLGVHSRHREPVLEYQCGDCGRVFNAWTGTTLQGTHRPPREIL